MTICYFGSYDRGYSRNRVIIKGLRKSRQTVLDCHSNRSILSGRYLFLLAQFLRLHKKIDILIVGFPGHYDVPLAWLLAKLFKKKLVFDAFISLYDSRCFDRGEFTSDSWQGKFFWLIDKLACSLANKVLLDTYAHIDYFVSEFHLPSKKFLRVFVGSDETIFKPRSFAKNFPLIIGFHGTYLPAQGVEYIVQAAALLEKNKSLQFRLLGSGSEFKKCQEITHSLKLNNLQFLPRVSYKQLPKFISHCDIYLGGHFGTTPKAFRVIPNKVFEAMAMNKPIIVGESPAIFELLTDKKNCLAVKHGDPQSLATGIELLAKDQKLRDVIATNARQLFKEKLTSLKIGQQLTSDLAKL